MLPVYPGMGLDRLEHIGIVHHTAFNNRFQHDNEIVLTNGQSVLVKTLNGLVSPYFVHMVCQTLEEFPDNPRKLLQTGLSIGMANQEPLLPGGDRVNVGRDRGGRSCVGKSVVCLHHIKPIATRQSCRRGMQRFLSLHLRVCVCVCVGASRQLSAKKTHQYSFWCLTSASFIRTSE